MKSKFFTLVSVSASAVALTLSNAYAQAPAGVPTPTPPVGVTPGVMAKPEAAAKAVVANATASKVVTTASGLKYEDVKVGTGAEAKAGQNATVHYTGWLWVDGKRGNKFDSSKDRGQPFDFPLGGGRVIKGWDEGVQGMKVGGTRILTIAPELGYGARGAGGVIPPNATLQFEVELLGAK
jgi:FKBP-type peptidyl-prolyl cis-trans isomerase